MADIDEKPTVVDPLVLPSSPIRAIPPPGTRIGKYVVDRPLGTGGMGVVVAAHNEQLGELVAIKLMHAKAAKNAQSAERFAREAKQTVRIKSERVVRVLDAGTHEETGAPFIVMEYLEGRDLGRVLTEDGPLHPTVCADLMLQVCEALAAAHALGIVHRDLKPSNFFLTATPDGSPLVKVLDFGISKMLAPDMSEAKLTETQAVFGSPTYMSPEQIRSSTNVDQRSDVWSLGVAMFELLTGKMPFMADNVAGLLASIVADAPFPIATFRTDVPPQLEAIVYGCLEKDVTRRIQSVAQLASALKPFASSAVDASVITGRIERLHRASQAPGMLPSMTPHGGVPSIPPAIPVTPRSFPPPPGSSQPSAPAPMLDFSKTTGTDLSATGDPMKRMRGGGTGTLAIAIGAVGGALLVLLLLGVGSVLYLRSNREPKNAAAEVAPPPPSVTSIAPTAPPPTMSGAEAPPTAPSAGSAPAPTGKSLRGKTRPSAAKVAPQGSATTAAPAPPPAPPATTANPDTTNSRY